MSDVILHHYAISPYAEKIRRILGFKGMSWQSVDIPVVAPKPDLTALTGGYRKTPVLQIGADVYCDTDLIARVLERLRPEPTLFPAGTDGLAYMVGPWQQEIFMLAVYQIGTAAPVFPDGFIEDRSTMVDVEYSMEKIFADVGPQREQLRAKLAQLDAALAGRPFVLGDAASLADFALFHPIFGLRQFEQLATCLAPWANVTAWADRIEAFGYGTMTELSSAEAITIAKAAAPAVGGGVEAGEPNDLTAGQVVDVVHESFGNDPTRGTLVASSVHEIAVRRDDPRAGDVVVHFPREHYLVHPVAS